MEGWVDAVAIHTTAGSPKIPMKRKTKLGKVVLIMAIIINVMERRVSA